MSRIARLMVKGEPAVYHIMSRTALDRFVIGDTDSGIIGSKAFVSHAYNIFKDYFECRHDKQPRPIQGLDGIYSLKRLSEKL